MPLNFLDTKPILPLAGSYNAFYRSANELPPSGSPTGGVLSNRFNGWNTNHFLGTLQNNTLKIAETTSEDPIRSDEIGDNDNIDAIVFATTVTVSMTLQDVNRDACLKLLHPYTRNDNGGLNAGVPGFSATPGVLQSDIAGALVLQPMFEQSRVGTQFAFGKAYMGNDQPVATANCYVFPLIILDGTSAFERAFSAGLVRIPIRMRAMLTREVTARGRRLVNYTFRRASDLGLPASFN